MRGDGPLRKRAMKGCVSDFLGMLMFEPSAPDRACGNLNLPGQFSRDELAIGGGPDVDLGWEQPLGGKLFHPSDAS